MNEDIFADTMKPVPVDEARGIFVRAMGGDERDEFEAFVEAHEGKPRSFALAKMAELAVCDKDGNRRFADGAWETLRSGKKVSAKMLHAIFKAAFKLNRLGDEGVESEKKDSAAVPTCASGYSSPALSE
jgi:hypothetical protein